MSREKSMNDACLSWIIC